MGTLGSSPSLSCSRALRRKPPFLISSCSLRLRSLQRPASLVLTPVLQRGLESMPRVEHPLPRAAESWPSVSWVFLPWKVGGLGWGGAAGSAPALPPGLPAASAVPYLDPGRGLSICSLQWAGGGGAATDSGRICGARSGGLIPNHLGLGNTELAHVPAA